MSFSQAPGHKGITDGTNAFLVQVTSKYIASNVRKARLINLYVIRARTRMYSHHCALSVGLAGEQNVQGEDQKKLDVLSDQIMVNALRASGKTAVLVTEEQVSQIPACQRPILDSDFSQSGRSHLHRPGRCRRR